MFFVDDTREALPNLLDLISDLIYTCDVCLVMVMEVGKKFPPAVNTIKITPG